MKKLLKSFLFSLLIINFLTACGDHRGLRQPVEKSTSGPSSSISKTSGSLVTYEDVQPLFKKLCASCHNKSTPDINWLDKDVAIRYAKTKGAEMKRRVVAQKGNYMPMDGPFKDMTTDADRQLIGRWVDSENGLITEENAAEAGPDTGNKEDTSLIEASKKAEETLNPILQLPEHLHFVKNCFACHGANGISSMPGTPNLAGQDPAVIESALNSFLDDTTDPDGTTRKVRISPLMASQAAGLTKEQIQSLKEYIPNLKVNEPRPLESEELYEKGKVLAASCVGCHASTNHRAAPGFPNIVFQDKLYIKNQLNNFITDVRMSPVYSMKSFLEPLVQKHRKAYAGQENAEEKINQAVQEDFAALAEFFGSYQEHLEK